MPSCWAWHCSSQAEMCEPCFKALCQPVLMHKHLTRCCCCCVQVHGDVFRPPTSASLLASFVGTGVQLLGMTLITMIFALLGFLSPANRGGLMTAMVMMFVFMGLFGGYFSARLYKTFRGDEWKKTTLRTALLFPGERAGPGCCLGRATLVALLMLP
jgi:hypothetical protein